MCKNGIESKVGLLFYPFRYCSITKQIAWLQGLNLQLIWAKTSNIGRDRVMLLHRLITIFFFFESKNMELNETLAEMRMSFYCGPFWSITFCFKVPISTQRNDGSLAIEKKKTRFHFIFASAIKLSNPWKESWEENVNRFWYQPTQFLISAIWLLFDSWKRLRALLVGIR